MLGTDEELVPLAQLGNREALEALVSRHQSWIYNVVLRMVYLPQDAEDITQEILIKLLTKLSTFEQRSSFRTWLYRIAVNHVLNMKRTKAEQWEFTFEQYGAGLRQAPDEELPDPHTVPVDLKLIVEEAEIGCTTGMLLCLSREQRLVFILGEILGVTDLVGAELLDVSRDNFRQKLSRAEGSLSVHERPVRPRQRSQPCRCAKKTQAFIRAGYLDPNRLIFANSHLARVRDVAPKAKAQLEALDEAYCEIHRAHPFQSGPDFVAALRRLIGGAAIAMLAWLSIGCARPADDFSPDAIVALEKGALDRWGKGDPAGYFEIMAASETYFDPMTEKRIDGVDALRSYIAPFTGKISIERVEMIDPRVQRVGDVAVLTFNLNDYGARIGDGPKSTARWNSTEIYQRIDGKWKIVHSHWSYVKPPTPTPPPPVAAPPSPGGASSRASGAASSSRS